MTSPPPKPKRKRGVVLSSQGLQRLQAAQEQAAIANNGGYAYTLEQLAELTGLSVRSIGKLRSGKEAVDRQTLEEFFRAFNLNLTERDYVQAEEALQSIIPIAQDWGEAMDVSHFYGRAIELGNLQQWVLQDRCRLIGILGMGGVGKTTLATKLAEQVQDQFSYVIWRSLRNAPPLETLLADLVPFLSGQQETKADLSCFLQCLRDRRCLVILDNMESLLDSGDRSGQYRLGYEAYSDLLRVIAETHHQSCVMLTTRERCAQSAQLEGHPAVRGLPLNGSPEAAKALLDATGLTGTESENQTLCDRYCCNPLALKIVATTIRDLFGGNIALFLEQNVTLFGDIFDLIQQHYSRLSILEKQVMLWLAINREWVSLAQLQADWQGSVSPMQLMTALQRLQERSLIEVNTGQFTLQPVVMEYITEQLLITAEDEIEQQKLQTLKTYALLKAEAVDYIRESQRQLILEPLIGRLMRQLGGRDGVICHLRQLLRQCQKAIVPFANNLSANDLSANDYGAGNLLNLLSYLKADLTGADLSGLMLQQVDLANTPLHQVNLSNTHFSHTRFAESLTDITRMDVNPNGVMAMAGMTGRVFLYNLKTGQWLNSWIGHQGWVWIVVFSTNGQTFFTGSVDQRIAQWDVATGQCLHQWQTDSPVMSLAVSADGQWLASGHANCTAQLWHLQTKQRIGVFEHPGAVLGSAFHPQTHHLAIAGSDRTIALWDCATGERLTTLIGHNDIIWDVSFSAKGDYLASASSDGSVKLWSHQTENCLYTLQAGVGLSNQTQFNQINQVRFSPDDRLLACACQNSMVRLWDVASGKLFRTLQGHRGGVWTLAFGLQEQTLMSGGEAAQVKIWQVESGHCMRTLQGKSMSHYAVAIDPTGTLLASGGDDALMRLWSVVTEECLQTCGGHEMRILASAFHPETEHIATGSLDGLVKLWDFQGHCLHTYQGHENWVFDVTFHPTQPLVVSCGADAKICFWCMRSGSLVHTLVLPERPSYSAIAFHPQGQIFASSSVDKLVRLWDDASKVVLRELSGHTAYPWCLAFHPQGELLASGAHDGTVKLWEVSSGNCVTTFSELSGLPMSVSFSPDGQMLAVGCDRTIYIWKISTGKCVKRLEGHSNGISSITFHPKDSSILISASYDETIRFWDTATGDCLKILRPDRLYEGMNIQGATGLSSGQKAVLKQLGAVELQSESC